MSYFPIIVSSICGLLLVLLVSALIINKSFRSDVLGGEGEATVLGLLSIKGVVIVVLCGLFLGGFIYPLKYCTKLGINKVEEQIRAGLESKSTESAFASSLINIIEKSPPDSLLSKKLIELAEARKTPFHFPSRKVELTLGENTPPVGFVGVCEQSDFIKKNIVVYLIGDNNEMLYHRSVFADSKYAFPCHEDTEKLVINKNELSSSLNQGNPFAKLSL